MAQYKGDDLVLYTYEDLEPIGCEDSFVLNITSNEIITTTKGSGRATNREYGSYDWNVQCTGVITLNEAGKASPLHFNDNIIKGKKVAIKATVGEEFYFGLGIITTATNTGTSGEFAKFDVTIAGDGILYSTNDLKNTESEPTFLAFDADTSYASTLLYNAKILMLFVNDGYVIPAANTYSFDEDNGSGQGVITFNNTYAIFLIAINAKIKVYFVPA
jgi:hypothetical protein